MSVRIEFDGDDFAKVRIAGLNPLTEVEASAHRSLRQPAPILRTWAQQTRDRLGPAGPLIVADLRSPIVQIANFGLNSLTFFHTFEEGLNVALSQPSWRWQSVVEDLAILGISLSPTGVGTLLNSLERSALNYYEAALAPHWEALVAQAESATNAWVTTMRHEGLGAMFNTLYPGIKWEAPILSVNSISQAGRCPPGCPHYTSRQTVEVATGDSNFSVRVSKEGLHIIPSIFSSACAVDGDLRPGPRLDINSLIVPVPVDVNAFGALRSAGDGGSLIQLLGMTRACVLVACLNTEQTTTSLAGTVGVSVSSASEHAAVLRSAGLLSSRRERNAVLHTATSLGKALADSRLAHRGLTAAVDLIDPPITRGADARWR
jgi:DNA-binding transcriptional ArsR family regulator